MARAMSIGATGAIRRAASCLPLGLHPVAELHYRPLPDRVTTQDPPRARGAGGAAQGRSASTTITTPPCMPLAELLAAAGLEPSATIAADHFSQRSSHHRGIDISQAYPALRRAN